MIASRSALIVGLGGVPASAGVVDRAAHLVAHPDRRVDQVAGDLPLGLADRASAVQDRGRERYLQPGQHKVPVEGINVGVADQDAVAVGVDLVSGTVGDLHHMPVVGVGIERRDKDIAVIDRIGAFLGA